MSVEENRKSIGGDGQVRVASSTKIIFEGVERRAAIYPRTLAGDPDGELKFVPELGMVVPTFVNPRLDLVIEQAWKRFSRLTHHIPLRMRGLYKVDWLPEEFLVEQRHLGIELKQRDDGFAMCNALRNSAVAKQQGKQGHPCLQMAANRTGFCRSHGGALHPADKVLSARNRGQSFDPVKIAQMDRVQLFLQSFLKVEELEDDEVAGGYIRNDEGTPIYNKALSQRMRMDMTKELHKRVNNYMQTKLPTMVKVISDIAESDFVEPADRIKAASIIIERMMGRTPEVVIHGKTDKPYETVFESIDGGSREAYRNNVRSERVGEIEAPVIDVSYSPVIDVDEIDSAVEVVNFVRSETSNVRPETTDSGSYESLSRSNGESDTAGTGSVSVRHGAVEKGRPSSDTGAGDDESGADDSNGYDTGIVDEGQRAIDIVRDNALEKARQQKEIVERIKKAKRRRYAARAVGAATVDNIPWLLEFKPVKNSGATDASDTGKFTVKVWSAEGQTEAVVDRILRSQS